MSQRLSSSLLMDAMHRFTSLFCFGVRDHKAITLAFNFCAIMQSRMFIKAIDSQNCTLTSTDTWQQKVGNIFGRVEELGAIQRLLGLFSPDALPPPAHVYALSIR